MLMICGNAAKTRAERWTGKSLTCLRFPKGGCLAPFLPYVAYLHAFLGL